MLPQLPNSSLKPTINLMLAACCALGAPAAIAAESDVFIRHFDGVLGTSLDITLYGVDAGAAETALEAAMAEIARLDAILSTYRDDSELMRLNAAGETTTASPELIEVLQHCERWYAASEGAFSCRMAPLQLLWRDAEANQRVPERPEVRALARAINQASVNIDAVSHTISLEPPIQLDASGLATGYIIDRAFTILRTALPEADGIKFDIGGDARYSGSPPDGEGWQVAVADPNALADNAGFVATLALGAKAVTASGHASRKRTIERRDFSHILVPRDGWPVENGTSSVVVADDALVVDAVATALATRSLTEAIDWVETLDGVEALVIDSAGHQLSSSGWSALTPADSGIASNAAATSLKLDYTLPSFNAADYNRPYLAIWISDADQKPVKNLLLLGETERWARENTRWWRRVGRRNPELIDGVARPTRGPGEYNLQWDGTDDFGVAVQPGAYLLHVEASRENGGSTYRELPFAWGGTEAIDQALAPDGELGSLRLQLSNGQPTQ